MVMGSMRGARASKMVAGRKARRHDCGPKTRHRPGPSVWIAGLLVVAFLFSAVPADAVPEEAERNRYRAEFKSRLPGIPPHTVGQVYTDGGTVEATVAEMAEMYAQRMLDLQSAVAEGAADSDQGGKQGSGKTATQDPVLYAGTFSLWEFLNIKDGNPAVACSHLQDNAHYTIAVPTEEGGYVGAAYSDVSDHPNGIGKVNDLTTGNDRYYNMPVYYGGQSNFWCAEVLFPSGSLALINNPSIYQGFVVGADD